MNSEFLEEPTHRVIFVTGLLILIQLQAIRMFKVHKGSD